jgi:hypothetical protein
VDFPRDPLHVAHVLDLVLLQDLHCHLITVISTA